MPAPAYRCGQDARVSRVIHGIEIIAVGADLPVHLNETGNGVWTHTPVRPGDPSTPLASCSDPN